MKRNQRARVRKKERKKERNRFFLPVRLLLLLRLSSFRSLKVFFLLSSSCCCCSLQSGGSIKIECKKKAPKKNRHKKKAKKGEKTLLPSRIIQTGKGERHRRKSRPRVQKNVLRRPKAGSSGRNGLLPSEEVSFFTARGFDRKTPETARPVSRDVSGSFRPFGRMDRFYS